jgi:hypothetical protein
MSISGVSSSYTTNAVTDVKTNTNSNRRNQNESIGRSESTNVASSTVTLSNEAKGFAELASKGITSFTIKDGHRALQDLLNGTRTSGVMPEGLGGTISADDFDKIMMEFGATKEEAEHIRNSFDADGDKSITHEEVLNQMANTLNNNADSQNLLDFMDRSGNNDGVVQQDEYMDIQTSIVYAERKA